jgi:hypothetical protein
MKPFLSVPSDTFKQWIQDKQIRPASLEDVHNTHHARPCFAHPNTGQPFVALPNTDAAQYKETK